MRKRNAQKDAARMRKYRAENREHYRAVRKAWRVKNRDKLFAQSRAAREANPDKYREYHLRAAYGLTIEQFNEMAKRQNYRCASCESLSELHVDHCHDSGAVRALLCQHCNRAFGILGEDPVRIRALAAYAEKFDWLKK